MKKTILKHVLVLFGVLFFFSANAQLKNKQQLKQTMQLTPESQNFLMQSGYVRCASVEMDALRRQREGTLMTNPGTNDWIAPLAEARKLKIAAQKLEGTYKAAAVVNIPIIFHVISSGSGATNLSAATIQAQIDQLNIDFSNAAGSTHPAAADAQIVFIPALVAPNGNILAEPGIDRITAYGSGPFPTSDFDVGGGGLEIKSTGWDYNQYANVWTADISGGILGYAQFPSNSTLPDLNTSGGTVINNGVVIGSGTVGSVANPGAFAPYNLGRTLTHEAGHWIGLRHTWGDSWANGDPDNASCSVDDFCNDTPNSGRPNYGCPSIDTCVDGTNDMVQNYMDYSNDSCMNIFTTDQVGRIQTVLANADGLSNLPNSTAGSLPSPVIAFTNATQMVNEGTDCSYTDVVINVSIGQAPSANADITISATGTASSNDYLVIGGNLTFPAGSNANQTFTLRVYNDSFVEANEQVILDMTLNANGGDATLTTTPSVQNIVTIVDTDLASVAVKVLNLFTEDGNGTFGNVDGNVDGHVWGLVNGLGSWGGITDPAMFSESDLTILGGIGSVIPDNYIIAQSVTIPVGTTVIDLSYALAGYTTTEPYELYFATDTTNATTIQAGTLLVSGIAASGDPGGLTNITAPLSIVGQTGSLVMRHVRTDANGSLLIWDTVTLSVTIPTEVQTIVNAVQQNSLTSTGTIFIRDTVTENVMVDVSNNNNVDYGCVDINVSRATGPAVQYQTTGVANLVMGKTFTITPSIVQAVGVSTIKFYFTEVEILDWETSTGNSRNSLVVIKDTGANSEIAPTILGSFGANVTLEVSYNTGINGTYYFGKASALTISENEFAQFNIYPNPTNRTVSITLSSQDDVKVSLFDIQGRVIYKKVFNNRATTFKKEINFGSLASGVYLLNVESNGKRSTKKLIKQ